MNLVRLSYRGGGANIEPYTVIVTLDENFENKDVFLSQIGQETLKKTCLAPDYTVEFKPMHDGVWTITTETIDGRPISLATDPLLAWGTYSYVIESGFDFQEWLTQGRVTQTFATLDDVLADEKTVRQLMTVHDSVDYLVDALDNGDDDLRDKLLASDNALKWIGISDYAYEQFDNELATFINSWLLSDKWEYALNSHVPVMTSDTAPYGKITASSSEASGDEYFRAFDGDINTYYSSTDYGANNYICYEFTNPIKTHKANIIFRNNLVAEYSFRFKIQATNNDVWEDVSDEINVNLNSSNVNNGITIVGYIDVNSQKYYKKYRLIRTYVSSSSTYARMNLFILQFYGRQLKVSVPKMDGNNSPYGECLSSNVAGTNYAYRAFDNNETTYFATSKNETERYIGYDFGKKVAIKQCVLFVKSGSSTATYQIEYSDDKSRWEPCGSQVLCTLGKYVVINIESEELHRYWRAKGIGDPQASDTTKNYFYMSKLQFYGLDYSEKEFAQDGKVEYIYDHGVKLLELDSWKSSGSTCSITELDSSILIDDNSTSGGISINVKDSIDLTNVSLVRAKVSDNVVLNANSIIATNAIGNPTSSELNRCVITSDVIPNNIYCKISNASAQKPYIQVGGGATTGKIELTEWWLEK